MKCENCKQIFYSGERMEMHKELGLCQFREEKPKDKKETKQKFNGETLYKEISRIRNVYDYGDFEFDPFDSLETQYSESEDEEFTPEANLGNTGNLLYEQLSIDEDYPGVMDCLSGGAPYCCVVPSCNRRPYPTLTSMRRHYTTHDPEMYAVLICPICQYVRSDDHPGDMKKHIINKHGKDEAWAKENIIRDISEKLQKFRRATTKDGTKKSNNFNPFSSSLSKVEISLDDPNIRASFTGEGGSDYFLICGVPDCRKNFKSAYKLKQHYGKHDDTLRKNSYECNLCEQRSHRTDRIKIHVEKMHPEVMFLLESGEEQWKTVKCERWEAFSEEANSLIEESQEHKHETFDEEEYETIHVLCTYCSLTFNTKNAYLDHDKMHHPNLINFTCDVCQEGFIVESVFINHVKGHKSPYTSMKYGSIRCNGCSQYFQKLTDVKKHLKINHMNLLNNCVFCDHCNELFLNKKYLEKHMFTHAEQVFRCPVCSKRFLTQEEVDVHVHQNTCKASVKNYLCPLGCGGKFTRTGLALHKRTCKRGEEEIFTWDRDRDL